MAGEFDRIQRYFMPLQQPPARPAPVVGNGDDALAVRTDQTLVMSIDTAVAGTHFPHEATPEQIASKAIRSAVSDLAAMGASPWFYTLALVVPTTYPEDWWDRFGQALALENQYWQMPCLGGDTTTGPSLVVTVQVHGLCERPLTRSGAQVGDDIWITGTLGDAAAGLAIALGQAPEQAALTQAFYAPEPPVSLMVELSSIAHAAIDVSDGLVADLGHIVDASHCGAQVAVESLPLSAELKQARAHSDALSLALTGGEDYSTCFTAPASQASDIVATARNHQVVVTRIGAIVAGKGLRLTQGGKPYFTDRKGYDHFV